MTLFVLFRGIHRALPKQAAPCGSARTTPANESRDPQPSPLASCVGTARLALGSTSKYERPEKNIVISRLWIAVGRAALTLPKMPRKVGRRFKAQGCNNRREEGMGDEDGLAVVHEWTLA
jgi:hypothetical protein